MASGASTRFRTRSVGCRPGEAGGKRARWTLSGTMSLNAANATEQALALPLGSEIHQV
ncbi:MAG: hypothetical protein IT337_03935 [Thermomicrobiales bacterium]|nr:hypothetical protein [Thermomicrobiales bacterium]